MNTIDPSLVRLKHGDFIVRKGIDLDFRFIPNYDRIKDQNREVTLYGQQVLLYSSKNRASSYKVALHWNGFNLNQIVKWDWYFRYRTALLQVENPTCKVQRIQYQYVEEMDKDVALTKLKNRLINHKGRLNRDYKNLKAFEDNYSELFPIADHPLYKKARAKVYKREALYQQLQNEYDRMLNEKSSLS